jgi:ABC-type bacteriocin/lantibiotic exporter with double-glycine peptidase domain
MMVQYRITEDDYVSALGFHAWRRFIARPSTMTLVAGGIAVVLLGFILWAEPSLLTTLALAVPVFAIVMAITLFVQVPRRARRHYQQYKSIEAPITLELMDAGVKFSNADGEGIVRWSNVYQWRQNDRFILIYTMPVMFYIVPKSVAQEGFGVPLLVQRLAEHVGPER